MELNQEQIKAINEEVINYLSDMTEQVKRQGIDGLGIDFNTVQRSSLLDEATDALASGDMLRCVIMSAIDGMSMFKSDDE